MLNIQAQIVPISTHYTVLRDKYNPAFNGLEGGLGVVANYRTQWTELQKAPKTLNLVADIYLPQISSGLGLNIMNDRLGAYNQTAIAIAYNYIQPIKEKFKIGIGIQAGANISKLDGSLLVTPQGDYSTGTNHNDDVLSSNTVKSIAPILDFGVSLHHKYFELGVALQNLINYKYEYQGNISNLNTTFGRTLNFTAKGNVELGQNIHLKPAVNFLTDFKNIQTDITLMAGFKYFIDAGINVRI
ncbi:MAG: PorP/SprF family type IX secretion system membrane protein [Chitinophagales bacterium]